MVSTTVATAQTTGDIRLVGGNSSFGRVEIFYNNAWGTVCDDGFSSMAANIACKTLRLPGRAYSIAAAAFGEGASTSAIHLDEVVCTGGEADLSHCQHDPWDINDCTHGEDVGIVCGAGAVPLRLAPVDGISNSTYGRLQVQMRGTWGDVCSEAFDRNAARVVCRSLGLPVAYPIIRTTPISSGATWLDGTFRCTGNETDLMGCSIPPFEQDIDCFDGEAITINCTATVPTLDVRLVGGNVDTEGRVEVLTGGTWGTVCDDNWSNQDAAVVCHMLGFPAAHARATMGGVFGEGSGDIKFDEVQCTGNENSLIDCRKDTTNDCDHSEDAGVMCSGAPGPTRVRLVGTPRPYEGRVEIYHNGQWGTMCDDDADINVAKVLCREIGYPRYVTVLVFVRKPHTKPLYTCK
ncbi:hypothetical protein ScPMuIL_008412 [Solemya velum]